MEKHNNLFINLSYDEALLFNEVEKQQGRTGIQNLKIFEKWQVSPLGEVKKAEFKERESISLKSSPKNSKLNKLNPKTEQK